MTDILLGALELVIVLGITLFGVNAIGGGPHKMFVAVLVIVFGMIGVMAIENVDHEPGPEPVEDSVHYDDYWPADGATIAYGSVELVDVGGTAYLHAIEVGQGTYVTADGTVVPVDVKKADLDVLMLCGQSNAAYYHTDPPAATQVPMGVGYYYGTVFEDSHGATVYRPVDSSFYYDHPDYDYAIRPMTDPEGTTVIGNMEPALAEEWYAKTGHKLLTVNTAWPGMALFWFTPGYEGKKVTDSMTAIWNAAVSAIDTDHYTPNALGMLWIQGETRAYTPEGYEAQYLTMVQWLSGNDPERGFSENPDFAIKEFFISLVRVQPDDDRAVGAQQAQIAMSQKYPDIHLATALATTFTVENGLMQDDDLHYSQAGDNLLGKAVSDYISKFYRLQK